MINILLRRIGVLKTTIFLSVFCIIVSLIVTYTSWQLADLPNLNYVLFVAFLCPTIIAPPVILSLCRLTEDLRKSKEVIISANTELQKSEEDKIKIYKAMIVSTEHILNNFLNQMLIFKLTAQETPGFNQEVLLMYDKIINNATTQIDALRSITTVDDISIHEAIAPKKPSEKSFVQSQVN